MHGDVNVMRSDQESSLHPNEIFVAEIERYGAYVVMIFMDLTCAVR